MFTRQTNMNERIVFYNCRSENNVETLHHLELFTELMDKSKFVIFNYAS